MTFRNLGLLLIGALLFGVFTVANAQVGNCPAGTIPNGDQRSPGACVPDPSYNQQSSQQMPPAIYVGGWGAVAEGATPATPGFGAATYQATKQAAESAALEDCKSHGPPACKILGWFRNECMAVISGKQMAWLGSGQSTAEATQQGLKRCAAEDVDCTKFYAACSRAARIQ